MAPKSEVFPLSDHLVIIRAFNYMSSVKIGLHFLFTCWLDIIYYRKYFVCNLKVKKNKIKHFIDKIGIHIKDTFGTL